MQCQKIKQKRNKSRDAPVAGTIIRDFYITMTNMLRDQVENMDNTQEHRWISAGRWK